MIPIWGYQIKSGTGSAAVHVVISGTAAVSPGKREVAPLAWQPVYPGTRMAAPPIILQVLQPV